MVSFQREIILRDDHELEINATKKRKREEPLIEGFFEKTTFDKHVHLETPLPSEWQRCLNIKSGEIHYLNTRTQRRTTLDPRTNLEEPPNHMSLDLELNLPYESLPQNLTKNKTTFPSSASNDFPANIPFSNACFEKKKIRSQELTLFPPRSELLEDDDNKREMITAVCNKCHMLVMMCKSSPCCPNCKFMHPLDQKSPTLFNQELSLFL